ncbi:uncharacterized protein LOC121395428 [Xenopus laevis]|uniref:Uncharacterized protein LOC121395428 n=1 Tax=Xenopus laevis TaxID=8355 RepID=A0A8J1L5R2_XENLA|nr:uncharacterized protein LOC121395428 [Xenopus laevis]
MPAEKFTNPEFLREFIELYRALPCLWKVKSGDYMNKMKREKAYEELANLCKSVCPKADVQFVKTRISNIRTVFKKELNKVQASKKSGASADDLYVPKLWYYDLLLFTVDQEVARDSRSNFSSHFESELTQASQSEDVTAVQAHDITAEQVLEEQGDHTEHMSQASQHTSSTSASSLPNTEGQEERMSQKMPKGRKRKNKVNYEESTQKLINEAAALLHKPSDEFDAFGFATASKLRRMDEEQRLFAESIITEALQRGLRKKLNDTTRCMDNPYESTNNSNWFPPHQFPQHIHRMSTPNSVVTYDQQTAWPSMVSPIPTNNGFNNNVSISEQEQPQYSHL